MAARDVQESPSPNSPSLLIVEDAPDLVSALESYFTHKRYQVKAVNNGDEALSALRATDPDILLLDCRLPGKTGTEVLREARGEGIDAPAIMVSVHPESELKQKGDDPGADAYLTKPFDLDTLGDRVDALLE